MDEVPGTSFPLHRKTPGHTDCQSDVINNCHKKNKIKTFLSFELEMSSNALKAYGSGDDTNIKNGVW